MKKKSGFSKGERGKFYRLGAAARLPVYLDAEVQIFVQQIADAKDLDLSTVVNQLLKSDMRLAEVIR